MARDAIVGLLGRGPDAYIRVLEEMFGEAFTPAARADFSSHDLAAFAAMLSSKDLYWPGLGQHLRAVQLPCLVLVGENDVHLAGATECARSMPNGKLVTLPGLDHMQSFGHTDVALPHVKQFLAEVGEN